MKKEDLMKLLRNPAKYRKANRPADAAAVQAAAEKKASHKMQDTLMLGVGVGVVALICITLLIIMHAKNRAENLTAALDPEQIEGLSVAGTAFDPSVGAVTYIQVQEGQDRNVAVSNLGSTLPIISRFNYKAFTPTNYEIIGAAPWALTTNFSSNMSDPDLMRYLLSNDDMIKAFLERPDVAPLLEDPQKLLAYTKNKEAMAEFFDSDTVKGVLANQQMLRSVAGSRFMSYLLISKSVKYFRDRPQEAAAIIAANPYLKELRDNPNVQVAVKENPYLKKIAPVLLGPASSSAQGQHAGTAKKQSAKRAKK